MRQSSIPGSLAPEYTGLSKLSKHVSYGHYFPGLFLPCIRASIVNLLVNLLKVHLSPVFINYTSKESCYHQYTLQSIISNCPRNDLVFYLPGCVASCPLIGALCLLSLESAFRPYSRMQGFSPACFSGKCQLLVEIPSPMTSATWGHSCFTISWPSLYGQ